MSFKFICEFVQIFLSFKGSSNKSPSAMPGDDEMLEEEPTTYSPRSPVTNNVDRQQGRYNLAITKWGGPGHIDFGTNSPLVDDEPFALSRHERAVRVLKEATHGRKKRLIVRSIRAVYQRQLKIGALRKEIFKLNVYLRQDAADNHEKFLEMIELKKVFPIPTHSFCCGLTSNWVYLACT